MRLLLLLLLALVAVLVLPLLRTGDSSQGGEVAASSSRSPPGEAPVRFVTLPPGSTLPSSSSCAGRVARGGTEARPRNLPENRTRGERLALPPAAWGGFPAWRSAAGRVDGDFTGTTEEIIRWASCKWGFDEDLTRAQALVESDWDQEYAGDQGQSVGLLQVKAAGQGTPHAYTWPHSRTSTAYNVDYALAWRRACFEGHLSEGGWLPAEARGELWGCVGLWYSGRWKEGDAAYVASVRAALAARAWPRGTPAGPPGLPERARAAG